MATENNELLIRKLPELLKSDEKEELLKAFGAVSVNVLPPLGHMRSCAFAKFSSSDGARKALMKLHQLKILGSYLVVEYAHGKSKTKDLLQDVWKSGIHSVNESASYSKPATTVKTVAQAVQTDELYVQQSPVPGGPNLLYLGEVDSRSESELSSDEENPSESLLRKPAADIQLPKIRKVSIKQSNMPPQKTRKVEAPAEDDLTIQANIKEAQSIQIKPLLQLPAERVNEMEESEEQLNSTTATDHLDSEETTKCPLELIRENRLSQEELQELALFRSYQSGDPSCKLYIKNIAKQATSEELQNLFSVFVKGRDSDNYKLEMKYMKTGRMKGQAFVTFSTEEEASEALHELNGYVLHSKPLVVYFSHSK